MLKIICYILSWFITPHKVLLNLLHETQITVRAQNVVVFFNVGLLSQKQILLLLIINSSLIKLPTCTNQSRCYMSLLKKKMSHNFINSMFLHVDSKMSDYICCNDGLFGCKFSDVRAFLR